MIKFDRTQATAIETEFKTRAVYKENELAELKTWLNRFALKNIRLVKYDLHHSRRNFFYFKDQSDNDLILTFDADKGHSVGGNMDFDPEDF